MSSEHDVSLGANADRPLPRFVVPILRTILPTLKHRGWMGGSDNNGFTPHGPYFPLRSIVEVEEENLDPWVDCWLADHSLDASELEDLPQVTATDTIIIAPSQLGWAYAVCYFDKAGNVQVAQGEEHITYYRYDADTDTEVECRTLATRWDIALEGIFEFIHWARINRIANG